jgi:endonuclease/exonuclease/phosphatase family metal-dependent hydrolase
MFKLSLLLFPLFLFSTNLKIASYNVENLFDMTYNGTEYKEYIPNRHNWRRKNYRKKLEQTSEVICDINADIIGLQEIENANVLKALQKSLRKVGCYYNYFPITHKKHSAIQVALLSKIPIKSAKELRVGKRLGYRPILELKFMVDKRSFYVYVNHWKSKYSAESHRIRSARVLMKHLNELPKESEYILLGDFNSDYNEYRHLKRKHNDSNGKTGINHVLKSINEQGYMVRNFKMKKFQHYNLWLELPNYKRWSHNFYGDKQGLDSILLPKTLFNGKGLEYVNHSFYVFKKNYLFHKKGYIFRWLYKNGRHQGKGYSDHLPIVATFSTNRPFKKEKHVVNRGYILDLKKKKVHLPLRLKRVKVCSISKNKAFLVEKLSKKSIAIYGTKKALKVGKLYDIVVYGRKLYKGSYEIIDFEIENSYDGKEIKE